MSAEPAYPRGLLVATPLVHELRACLLPLGERTQAQLAELHRDTTAERAYVAARAAHEVYVTLIRLATALERHA